MPDLTIDSESMRSIVQKAILDSLTDDQKELVIADAVAWLIGRKELPKNGYSYGKTEYAPSPLEEAFHIAVQEISHEVVREYLGDIDVREKVKATLRAQVDELVEQDRSNDRDGDYEGWLSRALSSAFANEIQLKIAAKRDR